MNKIYYSIREVAEKTGIEPQVLRYWEKEFPMLQPRRARRRETALSGSGTSRLSLPSDV